VTKHGPVVNPHLRSAYLVDMVAAAAEIDRLSWRCRQIIALAEQAPTITDQQLRARLLALIPPVSMAGSTR
jgi:hypothetical protein